MFEIVVICTGNRARSPLTEAYLAHLTEGLPVSVSSAGVLDLGAVGAMPEVVEIGSGWGLDLGGHRARCLSSVGLAWADLVLGFTAEHVAAAVVDGGADVASMFRLGELVELVESGPVPAASSVEERARAMVAGAHSRRSDVSVPSPEFEIGDPIGQNQAHYESLGQTIRGLCERLVGALFDVRIPSP